jgi:2-haloacid dehalogenase
MAAPATIAFDVNETLSDLAPLAQRFADVGAPEALLATWFAAVLRDGIALTVTGAARPFAEVARTVLDQLWPGVDGLTTDPHAATEHVLAGFGRLDVHSDVVPGVRALAAAGHPLVTLSNGAGEIARGLLGRANIAHHFAGFLSADEVGLWKPHRRVYDHAATVCEVNPRDLVLVAVHPWDLHGAHAAGLRTVWLDRAGAPYPPVFAQPDFRVQSLPELVDALR